MTPIALFSLPAILFASVVEAQTILTVNAPDASGTTTTVEYAREDLDGFEQVTYTTLNDYIDAPAEFSGPLVRDVLDLDALEGTKVQMTAINDYSVEVPKEDLSDYDVILATRQNGETMSVREKGPIWIMYPISDNPELADSIYNSRLVWQLSSITAE